MDINDQFKKKFSHL